MKVLVFENGEQSKLTMRNFFSKNYHELDVLAFEDSFENAKSLIEHHKPDFIFSDILLHGLSIFEVMQDLKDIKANNFILMTTHPELALQAISYEVMDYLLKPLSADRVSLIINKQKRKQLQNQAISRTNNISDAYSFLGISSIDKIEVIAKKDIIYAEADGRYTRFNLADHTLKTASKNLGEIEKLLNGGDFFRVHHSFIVNMNYVKRISRTDGYAIELKTSTKTIPVSKRRQNALMRYLQIKY